MADRASNCRGSFWDPCTDDALFVTNPPDYPVEMTFSCV